MMFKFPDRLAAVKLEDDFVPNRWESFKFSLQFIVNNLWGFVLELLIQDRNFRKDLKRFPIAMYCLAWHKKCSRNVFKTLKMGGRFRTICAFKPIPSPVSNLTFPTSHCPSPPPLQWTIRIPHNQRFPSHSQPRSNTVSWLQWNWSQSCPTSFFWVSRPWQSPPRWSQNRDFVSMTSNVPATSTASCSTTLASHGVAWVKSATSSYHRHARKDSTAVTVTPVHL